MKLKELQEKYRSANFGEVNVRRCYEVVDKRLSVNWHDPRTEVEDLGCWEVYLDHSCGDWIIGTVEAARKMSDDLREAANYCETRP